MWNLIETMVPEILAIAVTVLTGFAATALTALRKKLKVSLSKDQIAILHTAIESGLRYAKANEGGRNKILQDFIEDAFGYVLKSIPETVLDLKNHGATDGSIRAVIESKAQDVLSDALRKAVK